MTLRTATLRAARMLTPKVRELTLDPGPGYLWTPGQFAPLKLPLPGAEAPLARSYSIASIPRADGCFDLAVTHVEDGPGSSFLHAMAPGDTLDVAPPMGFFTLDAASTLARLFVATGTGLAPLWAMLQGALARGETVPTTVLLGVRTEGDLLYRDALEPLAAAHPWLTFAPTLSRPDAPWSGRTGYVQTHLTELVVSLGECDAYVCGLSPMIRAVRAVLKETLGFPRARIHTERYD